ncbi:MAG: tetratricopeptide repeat protein [Candidatus Methylomirabilia bacterium]
MRREVFAAGLLLLLAGTGEAQAPLTREHAIAWLKNQNDVQVRRQGASWLGETGGMADVPLLVEALRDADSVVRGLAEQSLWQIWSRSGDPEVDALFQLGLKQMNERHLEMAIETYALIIERKPDFAEGWNKRATVFYLAGEYEKSLSDCEEVIRRNPLHFGALSGFGLNYLRLGRLEQALDHFQQALAVNPNMPQVEALVERLERLMIQRPREII